MADKGAKEMAKVARRNGKISPAGETTLKVGGVGKKRRTKKRIAKDGGATPSSRTTPHAQGYRKPLMPHAISITEDAMHYRKPHVLEIGPQLTTR